MKFLYGKMNKIYVALIFVIVTMVHSIVLADENKIEFVLRSENCGGSLIQSTAGDATLSASADGINSAENAR